jgi:hypothetical protein
LVDIWRAYYKWLLVLEICAIGGILLTKVVILCGIGIFYMEHVLRRMGPWYRMWSYLVEENLALGALRTFGTL